MKISIVNKRLPLVSTHKMKSIDSKRVDTSTSRKRGIHQHMIHVTATVFTAPLLRRHGVVVRQHPCRVPHSKRERMHARLRLDFATRTVGSRRCYKPTMHDMPCVPTPLLVTQVPQGSPLINKEIERQTATTSVKQPCTRSPTLPCVTGPCQPRIIALPRVPTRVATVCSTR